MITGWVLAFSLAGSVGAAIGGGRELVGGECQVRAIVGRLRPLGARFEGLRDRCNLLEVKLEAFGE